MKRRLPAGWQDDIDPALEAKILEFERNFRWAQRDTLPSLHPKGYRVVRLFRGHPYANAAGTQLEHRLLVMYALGRKLEPYEHVHHHNEDKTDNRLSNLDIIEDVDHGHFHYGQRCGCGREFRALSFAGREIETDTDGTPQPHLKPENQEALGWMR